MSHNVFLIQILALVILATVSFVLFRSVMAGKDEIENSGPSLSEIEKTLRKVLDNTTLKSTPEPAPGPVIRDDDMPPPVVMSGMSPEQMEAHRKELEILRNELMSRENTLKELQKALEEAKAAGANAASSTEIKALETKVKELQAKLGEYEIIEDDIANLSTYKLENSKLKSELEGLRKRLSSQVEETGAISENVKQFSKLVGGESPSSIPLSVQQAAAEEEEAPEELEELEEMEASEEGSEEYSEEEAEEAEEEYAEEEEEGSEEEMEAAAEETEEEIAEEEVSEEEAEGATTTAGVLDEAVDTDKLLSQTKDLPETASNTKEDGDPGQKLINEFEDFMKGS